MGSGISAKYPASSAGAESALWAPARASAAFVSSAEFRRRRGLDQGGRSSGNRCRSDPRRNFLGQHGLSQHRLRRHRLGRGLRQRRFRQCEFGRRPWLGGCRLRGRRRCGRWLVLPMASPGFAQTRLRAFAGCILPWKLSLMGIGNAEFSSAPKPLQEWQFLAAMTTLHVTLDRPLRAGAQGRSYYFR